MWLFLDTETSGLPRRWKAPLHDLDNWPRLVQIAWLLADAEGTVLQRREALIRPEGFSIAPEAVRVHGITTERALAEGEPLTPVLDALAEDLARASCVVAHNYRFDRNVIGAEFLRQPRPDPLKGADSCCTMEASTAFCAIPGRYGYKWPTLDELHVHLFGVGFEGAHGALPDTEACMRCFFALREKAVVA